MLKSGPQEAQAAGKTWTRTEKHEERLIITSAIPSTNDVIQSLTSGGSWKIEAAHVRKLERTTTIIEIWEAPAEPERT